MHDYITEFTKKTIGILERLPHKEIAKALNILQAVYERDGRVYAFGNGGSWALAGHWVTDFNKTVLSRYLEGPIRRFQVMRVPSTDEELTAWANDMGFEMVFAGPLRNFLQDADAVVAISSSGNSPNIVKAVELAKSRKVPVIGLIGFDGGRLLELADAKIFVPTARGEYELVEGVHDVILHLMTRYFRDYFEHIAEHVQSSILNPRF